MGDGGVACMFLQHNIMERFPIPEKTAVLGGKNANNGFGSKSSLKLVDSERKRKKMKAKKQDIVRNGEPEKTELGLARRGKSNSVKEVENGGSEEKKDEIEEGELGTLKWPKGEVENGEFVSERYRRSEIEKGEIVDEKWRKSEVEVGEFVSGKWRRGDVEKGEIVYDRSRKGDVDFAPWRAPRDEIEKGEFIPDRWQRSEVVRDDYGYGKMHRYDTGKNKVWKYQRDRTPPSGKYPNSSDDAFRRKEFNRSGNQHGKATPRWEFGQERNVRISSKIVDEEDLYKKEFSNGKNHGKESSSGNRLKRYGIEPDINERKHFGDYGDYAGSKSRRLSDDSGRPVHPEHDSRHSVERSHKNSSSSSSSRIPPTDKYSCRHYDSTLSSRPVYDRHGRSPVHLERSPRDRNRYYDHRDRSPARRERSPYARDRSPYIRERSPYVRERSPYDRSRQYDHKNRSQSPQDRTRHHDRRDRTPNYIERSPHDRSRPNNHREIGRKSGPSEQRRSQHGSKGQEDKLVQREPVAKDLNSSAKESQEKSNVLAVGGSVETNTNCESLKEESQSPSINCKGTSHTGGAPPEELPSMEEDMDICDTPPHVSIVSDLSTGKWFYLDYYGVERGPSKLCDLKALVEEGALISDHMVKHVDSDRWMTAENAVSPLVTVNFPSIMPDSITQLVSPPEAPGNLLMDTGDIGHSGSQTNEEQACTSLQPVFLPDGTVGASEHLEDLRIDERIGGLFEGFPVIPGKELEALGEILQMTFGDAWWEEWGKSEGFTLYPSQMTDEDEQKLDELSVHSDIKLQEGAESWSGAPSDKEYGFPHGDSSDWFSGRWSCKGGDWKRNDESAQDRCPRKKVVLNDGFPLCQLPKSGYEDPRWHRKDDLYYPSQSRRLDLPLWAFSTPDEKSDSSAVSRSTQNKPPVVRGVKGTTLSVVRINACVVKDHGSFVSEPRMKVRGKERYPSRSSRSYSASSDGKRSSAEGDIQSKSGNEQGLHGSWKSTASINTPKDRICTVDDLRLHLGEWYYLDGAGHEQGPSSFSELQALADQGIIPKRSSVFRKFDRVWVPVTSGAETSEQTVQSQVENTASGDSSGAFMQFQGAAHGESNAKPNLFHNMHPQFIGYTLGKLHELVMKSYKTREFAAAINEALDPWINAKQPKKEMEKHVYWKSEGDARATKRARLLVDDSEDDEIDDNDQTVVKAESTFEDLCGDASFSREQSVSSKPGIEGWGILDGHVLARVFHFMRADMKSFAFASLTCKHWRAAVMFYRGISWQVDLSYLGPNCTDPIFLNIMSGYSKDKINSMVLIGCTNISSSTLEEILSSFSCLSTIDIRGCWQLSELAQKFQNFNWIKSRNSCSTVNFEDSHSKVRSLKQITDKSSSASKVKGLYGNTDDFGELKEYFDSVNKRDSANQLFRRSLYKRSKLFDARRSSSILSRDARTRRWAVKQSENGYKRMEEFLATSLMDIMKENTFDFFVPKVAEIQDKMKKGYYIGRGLSSVKEDISRMCRDAIKAKNRGDAGNMNRIITLFIQLATRLDGGSKSSLEKDEMLKLGEDDSSSGFSSTFKYKKKLNKAATEKKYMNRSNGTSSLNGCLDYGEDASDREIRRRLSKLNKRTFDSESETSDDPDRSSEYSKSSESTISESESDRSEGQTWQSRVDEYFTPDESLDSTTDDREWGARMTKASLVPPVTRKYEVIDQYVIVADEDDVKRKMQVSLPDDYLEKFNAQKNGTEESDMELPEVKDYKPRKQLGCEVIEQEVYGIDPYTHNLLLDSMPEELDWPLPERHVFIEDVLLRTLNKKVRHFTGTGNTPMMYPLQPVLEEIQDSAEEDGDIQTMRMCQGILRAIDSRTDDKYVAYRKGLGVVCNKEEGFVEDDFVVEFLGEVYPVWKWFEKQDGIRSLQKNNNDPAPEFYNIYLERPKGDADGYDLVVVDAMHKANYASRICHSCRPNCEAKVTAVDGHYQIGIYTLHKIGYGEEITFDYNSVTESKEEYEASVCLCGSQVCRGSYLNLTGEGAFQKVLKEWHGILDRHQLMVDACEANLVSEEDYLELGRAGLGSCLLGGLPDWLIAYSARLVRFINFERTKLPEEILRHNLEEKRKYFSDICLEVEKSDAEVQAEGVYNQRLQNLAVTLDKVRYVMRCVFGDPKNAPPPLERLTPEETVSFLWKGEGSLVEELLDSLAPHAGGKERLDDLKSKIHAHDPSGSEDIQKELKKSLLWLRDEVRNIPCTYKSRHDAAADLIHIYAHTKCFFRIREYKAVTSPPVYISPLDLGPKCKEKLGTGVQEYCKTYGENYCLGQLIFWHNQTSSDPDCSLARASRGCLSLPEFGSFYAKTPSKQRVYGPRTVRFMLSRMEKQPQKPWPKDRIWSFKSNPKVVGSPMLDAVLSNAPLDREVVHWLKHRPAIYQATWDQ